VKCRGFYDRNGLLRKGGGLQRQGISKLEKGKGKGREKDALPGAGGPYYSAGHRKGKLSESMEAV